MGKLIYVVVGEKANKLMGDPPEGGAAAGLMSVAYSTSFAESNPLQIHAENWAAADKATREIIRKVQPTSVSLERRRKVVDYIQRLIRNRLGVEVFSYGSVPLRTFLPDGDIDLTAFSGANIEEALVDDISLVLEEEAKNAASEFVVKDVQIIRAEVKLVKCIVQDIVVDVSFNQIGGLCTLCFLEQVDRLIGKDHLFKRSVILIKAWCYYESRILGARHGLISTYALETLVLYIFHLFHSELDGPLAVLYKFLDYFSKFDWDTYCVSLHGPVRLSLMPDIVAEMPEDSDRDLLLSNDFLSSCVSMFSVPSTSGDKTSHAFQRKHLNIIDPLRELNNLGRSISKGNFFRICSAFSYGARKLAQILLQPEISIANELHKFFPNAMERHGDVPDSEPPSVFYEAPLSGVHIPETVLPKINGSHEFQSTSAKLSLDLTQEIESTSSNMANREQHGSAFKHPIVPKVTHMDSSFLGDSNKLSTSGVGSPTISPDSSIHQTPVLEDTARAVDEPIVAPHLFFTKSKTHDGIVRDVNQDPAKCDTYEKNVSSSIFSGADVRSAAAVGNVDELASRKSNAVLSATKSLSTSEYPNHRDMEPSSTCGREIPKPLIASDLTGDYDGYLQCLQYGRWCYEYGLGVHSFHGPPLPTTVYQSSSLWDGLLPVSQFKQNGFSPRHLNSFNPNPVAYTVRPVLLPGVAFGWEEAAKSKGTGTYIPNTNQPPHGYRSLNMKGKNSAPSRSPRSNGRHMTFEQNTVDRRSYELSQPQLPVEKGLVIGSSDNYLPFSPPMFPNMANGLHTQPESVVEYEVVGHGSGSSALGTPRQQKPVPTSPQAHISQPPLNREQDRISLRSSYHLRDDDDFPPLSVQNGVERLSVL